jgi:hypothetical protein
MIWTYRFLWIIGALAIIAQMMIMSNPRYRMPDDSEWNFFENSRLALRKPKQWKQSALGLGGFLPADLIKDLPSVGFYRGMRTGFEVEFVELKEQNPLSMFAESQGQQMPQNTQESFEVLLRKAHDERVKDVRELEWYDEFKELKRFRTRIQGTLALRTDYRFVIPHPIPLFSMPVRGFVLTVPLSEHEAIRFNAYCPERSYADTEKIFEKILASIRLKRPS